MFVQKTVFSFILALSLSQILAGNLIAAEKINIVATTTTLADIAGAVAQDKAHIESIASPKQNIHHYAPTPKDVFRVKRADVFIHEGLDLEAWRGPLLDAAGRLDFMWPTGEKQIDVSAGIPLLEVPTSLSRAQGDIHAFGNPHYVGSPENAKIIASNIAEGLAKMEPQDADYFRKNADQYIRQLDEKIKDWESRMAPFKDVPVIVYHRSWPYFVKTFGLSIVGEVEPKPGIPPTAKHLAEIIRLMKERKVKVIIKEPFEESRSPEKIAKETGAKIVTLSQAVGEPKDDKDYISMMERNIRLLEEALKRPETGKGSSHE